MLFKRAPQRYDIEWIVCPECGLEHPVGVNVSPGVKRERRCSRCLNVEIAKLQRQLKERA